jgi:hypothetical protein
MDPDTWVTIDGTEMCATTVGTLVHTLRDLGSLRYADLPFCGSGTSSVIPTAVWVPQRVV